METRKKGLSITLKLISAIVIVFFAIEKLFAWDMTVINFIQFGEVLGINGISFMYFTGWVEMIAGVLILASFLEKKYTELLGFGILFSTMLGAIGTELFIRSEPKALFMSIALILAVISSYFLRIHFKKYFSAKDLIKQGV
ncbi:MAG: DoxX family protein [Psychroserpens sp.]|nr:DoxX family protein [Psychroserpens sp.]